MTHDIDIKRIHEDLNSALRYLKQMGFLNLWGGKVSGGDGTLYASVGNDVNPVEVSFIAQGNDLEHIKNLMEERYGHESGSADG